MLFFPLNVHALGATLHSALLGAGGGEGEEGSWDIAHGPWLCCRSGGMWNGAGGIGFPGETFHNTNTGLRGHALLSQTHPGAACGREESNAGAAPI